MTAGASAHRPPAILVVSADERLRGAVVGPLHRRYAQDYRILEADSPAGATELTIAMVAMSAPSGLPSWVKPP